MPEPQKLTVRQLTALHRGLTSLDGVKRGSGEVESFDFETGVRWNLTKNAVAVGRMLEAFQKFDRDCRIRHGVIDGLPITEANIQRINAYAAEIEPLKDQEIEVSGLLAVKLTELLTRPARPEDKGKPRTNAIPQSVLLNLVPLIEEDL